jgi:hypothetical protein
MEGGVAAEGGGLEELSQDQSLHPSPSQLQQCTERNQANVLQDSVEPLVAEIRMFCFTRDVEPDVVMFLMVPIATHCEHKSCILSVHYGHRPSSASQMATCQCLSC